MRPDKKWLSLYEQKRDKLLCPVDLNEYFNKKEICGKKLDIMDIGKVSLPSGKVIVRDPLAYLERENEPYFLEMPKGEFDTKICVILSDDNGDSDRYAAARVCFNDKEAVRFEEALIGNEDLGGLDKGQYFGFNVDAGMACICDEETKNAFCNFKEAWEKENKDGNIYDNYFAALFKKSYEENPKYQRKGGDFISFKIPNTNYYIPMFQSGFGDGAYPVYFGYDKDENICQIIIQFIDIVLG